MLIKTTMIRNGGSHVEINGVNYHFAPRSGDGAHVCDVKSPKHIRRFLQVDGYLPADMEDEDDEATQVSTPAHAPESDSEIIEKITLADLKDAPDLDEVDAGDDKDDGEGGDDQPKQAEGATDYDAMSDAELKQAHIDATGREPHPKANRKTIISKIIEAIEARVS